MKKASPSSPIQENQTPAAIHHRSVGFWLGAGILFLPIIFSWFTLRQGHSTLSRIVAFGWLIFMSFVSYSSHEKSGPHNSSTPAASSTPATQTNLVPTQASASPTATASPAPTQVASHWSYNENDDKMRGTKDKYASVESTNEINFSFPYSGGSIGSITVRDSAKFGKDILLAISKGQFTCPMGCEINAKFDDGKIETYSAAGAADGSSDTVFIQNYNRFLTNLKKSKKLIIEATFFNEGVKQLEFDIKGLQW